MGKAVNVIDISAVVDLRVSVTEFMVNTVYWVYTRITSNGQTMNLAVSRTGQFRRILDFPSGMLHRSFLWLVDGNT